MLFMPLYDFKCSKCDEIFEKNLHIGFKTKPKCPKCNSSKAVSKLITAPSGIIFKGSGFYSTDSRKTTVKKDLPAKCKKCDKLKRCEVKDS